MRRILGILAVLGAIAALFVFGSGAEDEGGGGYQVRGVFDNAGFAAPGMDVRIAGANVGSIAEIDVTFPGEQAHADGSEEPGKAVLVMQIDDEGFQDFRQDASCQIYPQSLLGEKYVDCEPTQERAPGTEAPPELAVIADGERGEGQRFLPLEQNGKAVDLDLVNNIMEEPYPDRFRLILNDLGAGLAARGDELAEIIDRSNPALRETNEVLATLARQNKALESLATDSDAIMSKLAAERERVASFINESTTVGEATLARRAELEETFERFPGFLRELRSTMTELRGFSDQATPVFGDLRVGAPALTRASEALGPFASAATRSFTTLGDAAEDAGPALAGSTSVLRQTRDLSRDAAPATKEFATLLSTLRRTGGYQGFFETIFGLGGTVNAYDARGHFTRAQIPTNSCFDYRSSLQPGCEAFFGTGTSTSALREIALRLQQDPDSEEAADTGNAGAQEETFEFGRPGPTEEPDDTETTEQTATAGSAKASKRSMRDLLDFMMGPGGGGQP